MSRFRVILRLRVSNFFSSIGLEFWNRGLAVSQGLEFYTILYRFNLERLYTYKV